LPTPPSNRVSPVWSGRFQQSLKPQVGDGCGRWLAALLLSSVATVQGVGHAGTAQYPLWQVGKTCSSATSGQNDKTFSACSTLCNGNAACQGIEFGQYNVGGATSGSDAESSNGLNTRYDTQQTPRTCSSHAKLSPLRALLTEEPPFVRPGALRQPPQSANAGSSPSRAGPSQRISCVPILALICPAGARGTFVV
jgi:hypothetical protein